MIKYKKFAWFPTTCIVRDDFGGKLIVRIWLKPYYEYWNEVTVLNTNFDPTYVGFSEYDYITKLQHICNKLI